jgi:hypothetical protein
VSPSVRMVRARRLRGGKSVVVSHWSATDRRLALVLARPSTIGALVRLCWAAPPIGDCDEPLGGVVQESVVDITDHGGRLLAVSDVELG